MSPSGDGHDLGARRILDAVDRWARATPDAPAVVAPDGTWTFREAAGELERAAAALRRAGVGPGTPVAVGVGRSRRCLPALLAIWRLGATAVLLDERHGVERLRHVLRDADARLLLGEALPEAAEDLPRLDPWAGGEPDAAARAPGDPRTAAEPEAGAAATDDVPTPADPHACAYVVYTSGTTGWPKGVEVTYGGLGTFLAALATLRLEPGGLGINAVSPAFDGWLWCTLLTVLHGQGVAIVDAADPASDLAEQVEALAPRTVSLTPSLLAACDSDLPSAEVIVVAGEPCPPRLLDRYRGRRLLNVYGPTETTIAATWADSAAGDDVRTIGRPLPGYRAYVLDADLAPVAAGRPGALYVAGDALARGYRNQPGLTAARFVPDPFGPPGSRMYRTGDVVSRRDDGQLEYHGRDDDQVKVRGFRVELAEIERVVADVAGVAAAAAFVTVAGDALAVAVVPRPGIDDEAGLATRIREGCARRLPAGAAPSAVQVVRGLPTSPNGKVDRAALAADLARRPQRAVQPTDGDLEQLVRSVWSDLLGRPVTDPDESFFDLGGHSLLAARAVAALRRETGVRVTMRQLLDNPTASQLARVLEQLDADAGVGGRRP